MSDLGTMVVSSSRYTPGLYVRYKYSRWLLDVNQEFPVFLLMSYSE